MTITKTLKVTAVMAVLTFVTFFMASGFSSLTMGSFPISDAFAQGGQNTANQGIANQIMLQLLLYVLLELLKVHLVTALQTKVMLIQEATLLVKQPVVELEKVATGGQNTANQGISQSNSASTSAKCAAGTLKGPACNSTTNQGNVNTGSNTAGQTAGGGTGTGAN